MFEHLEISESIQAKIANIFKVLKTNNENLSNLNIHESKVISYLSNSEICVEQIQTFAENYIPDNQVLLQILQVMKVQNRNLSRWISGFQVSHASNRQQTDDKKIQIVNVQCEICKNFIQKQKVRSLQNDIQGLPNIIQFASKEMNDLMEQQKQYNSINTDFYGTTFLNYQKKINNLYSKTQSYISQVLIQDRFKNPDFEEISLILANTNKEEYSQRKMDDLIKDFLKELKNKVKKSITTKKINYSKAASKIQKSEENENKTEKKVPENERIQSQKRQQRLKTKEISEKIKSMISEAEGMCSCGRSMQISFEEADKWREKYFQLLKEKQRYSVTKDGDKENKMTEKLISQNRDLQSSKFQESSFANQSLNQVKLTQRNLEKYQTLKIENDRKKRIRKKAPSICLNKISADVGVQCDLIYEKGEEQRRRKKNRKSYIKTHTQNQILEQSEFQELEDREQKNKKVPTAVKTKPKLKKMHSEINESHDQFFHSKKKQIGEEKSKSIKLLKTKKRIQDSDFQINENPLSQKTFGKMGKIKHKRYNKDSETLEFQSSNKQIKKNGRKTQYKTKQEKTPIFQKKNKTEENQNERMIFPKTSATKHESILQSKLASISQERKQKSSKIIPMSTKYLDLFGIEDLQLMGGISEAHSFQPLQKYTNLNEKQNTFLNKIVNHIENLSFFKNATYSNVVSFLKKPYETIENKKIYYEKKLDKKQIKVIISFLIQRHKRSCRSMNCDHMKLFLDKIMFQQK